MSDKHVRVILSAKDNNFTRALDNVNKQLNGLTSGAKKSEKNTNSLFSSIVKGGLVTAGVAKGMQVLSASVGDAVSRYDTLNRFPKQMKGLGFATDEVESSTQKLSKGIEGLPTRLDEVVSTASKFALMNKDLSYSTDLTLALNNAFLASGAGADEAQRGLVQFTQMMSKGKVDMQSWYTLTDTMGIGLNQLAESFGFAGESAQNDLYEALKSGEITFKEFSDKIIEMDKQVGGFADQAKTASEGIATSFKNIRTAVVNGVAKVITALDNLSKAFTGNSIAQNMDIMKGVITAGFDVIVKSISMVEPVARGLGNVFRFLANDSVILAPALMGVAAGFVALKVVQQINKLMNEYGSVSGFVFTKMTVLPAVINKVKASTLAMTIAYNAAGAGIAGMAAAAKLAITSIPVVGWVIGGVTAAVAAFVKITGKVSPETKKANEEMRKSAQAAKDMANNFESNNQTFERNQKSIEATGKSMMDLASRTAELANTQSRSGAQTKEMNENINALNDYLGESVVQFDKQTGQLNISEEAMKAYIETSMKQEQLASINKRLIELNTERLEAEAKLEENAKKQIEVQEKLNEASLLARGEKKEYKKTLEELEEAENDLVKTKETNATVTTKLTNEQQALLDEVSKKEKEVANIKRNIWAELSEEEKAVVEDTKKRYQDLVDATTNMFSAMEQKSTVSAEKLIENLKKNQETMANWGDNMLKLREKVDGMEFGHLLIKQFEEAGPQYASTLEALVNSTDGSIEELVALLGNGGTSAANALAQQFGYTSAEEMPQEVRNMVQTTQGTLSEQFNGIDWAGYGVMIPDGISQGIENNKPNVTTSTDRMLWEQQQAIDGFKPSIGASADNLGKTVTKSYGQGMTSEKRFAIYQAEMVKNESTASLDTGGYNKAYKSGQDVSQAYGQGATDKKGEAVSAVSNVKTGTQEEFVDVWKSFQKYGSDLVEGIRNGIGIVSYKPAGEMQKVVNKIMAEFSGKRNLMASHGQNMMQGLINGMNYKSGAVYNTAYNIANSAARAAQRALRIHSPSRVFRDIGNYTGDGMVVGIEEKTKSVQSAMRDMVDTSSLDVGFNQVRDSINSAKGLTGEFNSNIELNQRPAEFTFNLFGKTFKAFVDDVTNAQNKQVDLELAY